MSFSDYQERLARSIRVLNLPEGYDKENILSNLKNAGTIEDIKLGATEMIVTYSSSNEKDLSKMYDGCPVDDYVIKLEDTENFEVNSAQKEEEAPAPVVQNQNVEVEKTEEISSSHKVQTTETSSSVQREIHRVEEKSSPEPVVQVNREEIRTTQTVPEVQEIRNTERRPEAQPVSQEAAQQKSGENVKELLKDLQDANLPTRTNLPNTDLYNVVANRNYLLIFTLIWSLQLFLRSVF
jgi:hypothetical protein